MYKLQLQDFQNLCWHLCAQNPLITPPFPSPIIADPTFIFPTQSPDGCWHLYAHSLLGIHHFISSDGLHWQRRERVLVGGLRPFLYCNVEGYWLLYERNLSRGVFPLNWLGKWYSRLELIHSPDLLRWSVPTVLLEPSLDWQQDPVLGQAVSNPCLLEVNGQFWLYYSTGLVQLKDCGFNEPLYIGLAVSDSLAGPYKPLEQPILKPSPGEPYCNLGAGAIKVLRTEDGFVGFQNGIYWDEARQASGSAVLLRSSSDGLNWGYLQSEPLLKPSTGWMRSHVYALDVRRNPADGRFYLYFNARSDWHWTRGREHIGLLRS